MTLYAWIPLVIQSVVSTIILLGRGTVSADELTNLVMSSPGFLVDAQDNLYIAANLMTEVGQPGGAGVVIGQPRQMVPQRVPTSSKRP